MFRRNALKEYVQNAVTILGKRGKKIGRNLGMFEVKAGLELRNSDW